MKRVVINQIRAAANPSLGELFMVIIEEPDQDHGWRSAIIHATEWYSKHFPVGSIAWWGEDWLQKNTVSLFE